MIIEKSTSIIDMKKKNFSKSLIIIQSLLGINIALFLILITSWNIIAVVTFVLLIFTSIFYLCKILLPMNTVEIMINKYINKKIEFEDLAKSINKYNIFSIYEIAKEINDKSYEATLLNKETQINNLQRQINPHFLYNTLESIRGQAAFENVESIAKMTEALATFFKYNISQSGSMVTLEEELDNVNNYFLIQQYRFNNKFSINYVIDKDINPLIYYLPKLTLQPIVENSIFHGLEKKIGKGEVTIRITTTADRLLINIIDNGIGIEQEILQGINYKLTNEELVENNNGIALLNVNKRIKLNFGNMFGIIIDSIVNFGTDVEIVLPLITKVKNNSDMENKLQI